MYTKRQPLDKRSTNGTRRSIAILSVVAASKGYGPHVMFTDSSYKYLRESASRHLDTIVRHLAQNGRY